MRVGTGPLFRWAANTPSTAAKKPAGTSSRRRLFIPPSMLFALDPCDQRREGFVPYLVVDGADVAIADGAAGVHEVGFRRRRHTHVDAEPAVDVHYRERVGVAAFVEELACLVAAAFRVLV